VGRTKELDLGLLDGQLDPAIHELSEALVGGEPRFELSDAVGTNETANGFAAMDVGKFVVGTMTAWMVGIHATTACASTDLILHRDTSGVHRTELP
jgi:hypothetical protein